jgi:hypothetical protein
MVGTTGIEPVTPTMSTQRVDGNYSEIPGTYPPNVRVCSRSDHGNLGHFLGTVIERDDGLFAIGWGDDKPGPFESRQFAAAVAAKVVAA